MTLQSERIQLPMQRLGLTEMVHGYEARSEQAAQVPGAAVPRKHCGAWLIRRPRVSHIFRPDPDIKLFARQVSRP